MRNYLCYESPKLSYRTSKPARGRNKPPTVTVLPENGKPYKKVLITFVLFILKLIVKAHV